MSKIARRSTFRTPTREPFAHNPDVHLKQDQIHGPLSFFNPTRARFGITDPAAVRRAKTDGAELQNERTEGGTPLAPGVEYGWRSRDNRKGRHALIIHRPTAEAANVSIPDATNTWRMVLRNIGRMFTEFPVWDVSYLVAQTFTWGSVVFVINGLFYLLPLAYPSSEFPGESSVGGGVTSFIGCFLYELGVIFLMLETINENRTGCFGWAVQEALAHEFSHDGAREEAALAPGDGLKVVATRRDGCAHHHSNRRNVVGKGGNGVSTLHLSLRPRRANSEPPTSTASSRDAPGKPASTTTESPSPDSKLPPSGPPRAWVWLPSWHDLTTHYLHDLGFLGNAILFVAATVFGILGVLSLPPVYPELSSTAIYAAFWTPDVVGSVGFIVSSAMLMLETQPNWYTPAPRLLGWHATFWNLVGSVGFMLSATFGVCSTAWDDGDGGAGWCLYQSDLSTTWGSAAFLIGSVILWYESIVKYPVEVRND